MNRGVFWFRRDLRLADNPALERACQSHDALLLVYIDEPSAGTHDASRAWLRLSLAALANEVACRGGTLHVLRGDPERLLTALAAASDATAVHIGALHEPLADARDARLATALARDGVAMRRSGGRLLTDPDLVRSKSDAPYRVFTPFLKSALPTWRYRPRAAPERLTCFALPDSLASTVSSIGAPRPAWDAGFWKCWTPGEAAARARLGSFLDRIDAYPGDRDFPGIDGTSRLSPHLHFGEISAGLALDAARRSGGAGAEKFVAELGWREFAYYVLHHWPACTEANFSARFDAMPWREDPNGLRAWQLGLTGVPLVDAGMRQLWHEGWMHNRVRMIVASWLTKHMGIDWREGAAWFRHTLVDADLANNTLGWQWVAGTGVDAAPYYRIFNPVTQSKRFDPHGGYIRKWIPELASLDDETIHAPWLASMTSPRYPERPVIDLDAGRKAAMERLKGAI